MQTPRAENPVTRGHRGCAHVLSVFGQFCLRICEHPATLPPQRDLMAKGKGVLGITQGLHPIWGLIPGQSCDIKSICMA